MYRRPTGKKAALQLVAIYTLMTVAVLAVVTLFILLIFNYRFNNTTGELERQGLIQFSSQPSDAAVRIDGRLLSSRTATKRSVLPGTHDFTIEKEGYQTWYKQMEITAGSLVWLDYARLVPVDRDPSEIASYETLHASLAAPNRKVILLHEAAASANFWLLDITGEEFDPQEITIPEDVFTAAEANAEQEFTPIRWDANGRHVLVRHTAGSLTEWLVFDTKEPSQSQNISREFNVPVSQAYFSGSSGNILYVATSGNVRKIDLDNQTISRTLVENVADFRLFDSNSVTYVTRPDADTSMREVGLYREGDDDPLVLRQIDNPDVSVSIAMNEYYGQTYMALAESSSVMIYRGNYENSSDSAALIAERTFEHTVTDIEFNGAGNHLLVRANNEVGAYSIEQNTFASAPIEGGIATDLRWIDSMNTWSIINGQLVMREIDGANIQIIAEAALAKQAVTLSDGSGKYLYYFTENEDKTVSLQRIQMIL